MTPLFVRRLMPVMVVAGLLGLAACSFSHAADPPPNAAKAVFAVA